MLAAAFVLSVTVCNGRRARTIRCIYRWRNEIVRESRVCRVLSSEVYLLLGDYRSLVEGPMAKEVGAQSKVGGVKRHGVLVVNCGRRQRRRFIFRKLPTQ
jgi:hypothetical protein